MGKQLSTERDKNHQAEQYISRLEDQLTTQNQHESELQVKLESKATKIHELGAKLADRSAETQQLNAELISRNEEVQQLEAKLVIEGKTVKQLQAILGDLFDRDGDSAATSHDTGGKDKQMTQPDGPEEVQTNGRRATVDSTDAGSEVSVQELTRDIGPNLAEELAGLCDPDDQMDDTRNSQDATTGDLIDSDRDFAAIRHDTGEKDQQMTQPDDPGVHTDGHRAEVDSTDAGSEISVEELTKDTGRSMAEELAGLCDPNDEMDRSAADINHGMRNAQDAILEDLADRDEDPVATFRNTRDKDQQTTETRSDNLEEMGLDIHGADVDLTRDNGHNLAEELAGHFDPHDQMDYSTEGNDHHLRKSQDAKLRDFPDRDGDSAATSHDTGENDQQMTQPDDPEVHTDGHRAEVDSTDANSENLVQEQDLSDLCDSDDQMDYGTDDNGRDMKNSRDALDKECAQRGRKRKAKSQWYWEYAHKKPKIETLKPIDPPKVETLLQTELVADNALMIIQAKLDRDGDSATSHDTGENDQQMTQRAEVDSTDADSVNLVQEQDLSDLCDSDDQMDYGTDDNGHDMENSPDVLDKGRVRRASILVEQSGQAKRKALAQWISACANKRPRITTPERNNPPGADMFLRATRLQHRRNRKPCRKPCQTELAADNALMMTQAEFEFECGHKNQTGCNLVLEQDAMIIKDCESKISFEEMQHSANSKQTL
jgi:hypothetical protein